MYLGRVVETAPTAELFARPLHPYAQALLAEVPRLTTGKRRYKPVAGEIPSPLDPPQGCHFHPRCPLADDRCRRETPRPLTLGPRQVRCHAVEEGRLGGL
jgi:peptide/nickel transport system ATP-binding protein